LNYHDTIEAFFEKSTDQYISKWKENETPEFPVMHLLKENKRDVFGHDDDRKQFSVAIVPLTVPGGLPKGVSPMVLIKPIVKAFSPDAYIVFSEAWAVDADKMDKKIENMRYGDVQYMKNRTERLIIYGKSISGKQTFQHLYTIKRDTRTRKKWLVFDKKDSGAKLESERLP